jgi:hypothetical protein
MQPKPEHFGASFAEAFKDQRVVDAYRYRPPYPNEVLTFFQISLLMSLVLYLMLVQALGILHGNWLT